VARLLLADDSLTIQRVVELTFADEDVTVETVGDGDRAVALVDALPPDIVLADVDMPGRSGYEIARHIKQSPHLAHIPVVLLTRTFDPNDHARALEAGCDGVLAKPFEPAVAIATVRGLLGRSVGAPVATPQLPARLTLAPEPTGNYFERLDAAFADLSKRSAPAVVETAAAPARPAAQAERLPSLADAFAALLDAEQRQHGSEPIDWPATTTAAMDKDALVEEVVQRVLARLANLPR
jgi:CheY-like chemotaxis protein